MALLCLFGSHLPPHPPLQRLAGSKVVSGEIASSKIFFTMGNVLFCDLDIRNNLPAVDMAVLLIFASGQQPG